jgi:hypothetical protein
LLTLVGSADTDDASSMLSLCEMMMNSNVDVRAVSVTTLQHRPVVSVIIGAKSFRRTLKWFWRAEAPLTGQDATEALADVLGLKKQKDQLQGVLGQHAIMLTLFRPTRVRPDPHAAALFVQWRYRHVEQNDSHLDALLAVCEELFALGVPSQVLHARNRPSRNGWREGHARIALQTNLSLAPLAKTAQDEARRRLMNALSLGPHECQLTVVRHEWWLTKR